VSDTPENASDGGSIDQNDIDALFGGDSQPPGEPDASAPSSDGDFNQSDIDALLGAAGDTDPAPATNPPPSVESRTRVDTLGRPFDEAAAAMQAAMEEEAAATSAAASPAPPPPAPAGSKPFEFPSFSGSSVPSDVDPAKVTMLNDVNLGVRIELGRTKMLVEEVLRLGEGSVVELDRLAGDPVDVFANDRLVARGEVLVLNDSFCVRISEVFSRDPHRVVQ